MRRDPRDAVRSSVLRSSAEILAGAAKSVSRSSHAKRLRPGLAPTLGEVVTEFQSDSARTDSPVRILNAQPRSRVSAGWFGLPAGQLLEGPRACGSRHGLLHRAAAIVLAAVAEPPAMPAARGFIPDDRRTSAHVSDAPLGCFLGWRFWLCRKLKHRCLLTLA
jgi:hypothetical protein